MQELIKEKGERTKMKKILALILALVLVFAVAACAVETPPAPTPADPAPAPADPAPAPANPATPSDPAAPADPGADVDEPEPFPYPHLNIATTFPGVIAVITNDVSQSEEEFRSAQALQAKYGADKIVHRTWPAMFAQEGEMMVSIMREVAAIEDLGAVIINQAVVNTNAAVDALMGMRDDIFIVYASPAENPNDVAMRANLVLQTNDPLIGTLFVEQAALMGVETIAHYSFARHLGVPSIALRRDRMEAAAQAHGIAFVDLEAPDPMGDGGVPGTMMHITQDLPRQVDRLGLNTAFFGTNCAMQGPMISQVVLTGAMYIQPCCPSPYHGYPAALGVTHLIESGQVDDEGNPIMRFRDLSEVIQATRERIAERDMTGRVAGWPAPGAGMWSNVGVMYAIQWLNGNVPQEHGSIDFDMVSALSWLYIEELGERGNAIWESFTLEGVNFPNWALAAMPYILY
jgi:hypothetical protein